MEPKCNIHGMVVPEPFRGGPGQCSIVTYDAADMPDLASFEIHEVQEEARKRMLSRLPSIAASEMSPPELLQRLHELSPDTAKDFDQKGGIVNKLTFRLLSQADHVSPDQSYIILSYRWQHHTSQTSSGGSYVEPLYNDEKNQIRLPTSFSSFQAALGERLSTQEGVWVDQLCVDQTNEDEMAISIGCMDQIFRNARLTICLIDDIRLESEEENFMIGYAAKYNDYPWSNGTHMNNNFEDPFLLKQPIFLQIAIKILGSVYFSRAWCGHELRMASNRVFLLPSGKSTSKPGTGRAKFLRFGSHFFHHLLTLLHDVSDTSLLRHFATMRRLSFTFRQEAAVMKNATRQSKSIHTPTEVRTTANTSVIENFLAINSLAADGRPMLERPLRYFDGNRDKLSIMINLTGYEVMQRAMAADQLPKMRSVEICRRILLIALASRDPVVLCTSLGHLETNEVKSWLCWPRASDGPRLRSTMSGNRLLLSPEYKISNITRGTIELVKLDLTILAMAEEPLQPLESLKNNMTQFVDHWIDNYWKHHTRVPYIQRPKVTFEVWRGIILETMIAVAMCGRHWIEDFASEREMHGCQRMHEHMRLLFFGEDFELIKWTNPKDPLRLKSTQTVFHFLAYLLEHSLRFDNDHDSLAFKPVVFAAPSGAKILTYARRGDGDFKLAVPTAMMGQEFQRLGRCWLLEKRDLPGSDGQGWVLQGKHQLYGPSAVGRSFGDYSNNWPQQEVYPNVVSDAHGSDHYRAFVRNVAV